MSEWSGGYNVDLGYTYGYYREIAPDWMAFAALIQGATPPQKAWRYLELGCGQGVGLILLAALHPEHDFLGIDFNPLHIAHARALAGAAGLSNVTFEEADFVDIAKDWPQSWGKFDYVSAHGIYSWLAEPVRRGLIGTLTQATSPGALVYLSYNTQPGWISTLPVQHLLRLWQTSEELPSVHAIETGIQRLRGLREAKAGMSDILPGMGARVEQMSGLDRSYLVQEYLHDNWHPMWFDQVAEELSGAKLGYVGTATIGDHYVPQLLPPKRREILSQYKNPVVRQVMIDVMVNQGFRRDIFSRGTPPIWPEQQRRAVLDARFCISRRPVDDGVKTRLSLGEVAGRPEVYDPLLDALSTGPKTLRELIAVPGPSPRGLNDTLQSVCMMLHGSFVSLHRPITKAQTALRLNQTLASAVAEGAPYRYLLATKTGAVLSVGETEMIMFAFTSKAEGKLDAQTLASRVTERLVTLGRGVLKDGNRLTSSEDILGEMRNLAEDFVSKTLPRWRSIGVL